MLYVIPKYCLKKTSVQYSCVITGDLNLSDVEWSNLESRDYINTHSIVEFFSKFWLCYVQFVGESTRFNGSGSGSILMYSVE